MRASFRDQSVCTSFRAPNQQQVVPRQVPPHGVRGTANVSGRESGLVGMVWQKGEPSPLLRRICEKVDEAESEGCQVHSTDNIE